MHKTISHPGVVIGKDNHYLQVKIEVASACASCHASHACGVAEKAQKIVDVPLKGNQFQIGDSVTVLMSEKQGLKAVFFAYVVPFLLMMAVLIGSISCLKNELFSGMLAVAAVLIYYRGLFLQRKYIQKQFSFLIQQ